MKNRLSKVFLIMASLLFFAGCQKMDKPVLGNYPADANSPDGPLRFYAAFDGTGTDALRNGVDSIKATFPSENGFGTTTGVSSAAAQGAAKQMIKYPSFNGWAGSSSMSISVWFKKDGQTKNNLDGNGPEYIMSMRANNNDYHWSTAVFFLFIEGNNDGCAIKCEAVSPSDPTNPNSSPTDTWFTWEGGNTIPGILDNQWHHMVVTYDETTSAMKLYIDGVQNPNVRYWNNHGALRLATNKIAEYRVGRGPRNDNDGDGEGGWLQSSFKGGLDQLRLYNIVLTDAEIQALYTGKK